MTLEILDSLGDDLDAFNWDQSEAGDEGSEAAAHTAELMQQFSAAVDALNEAAGTADEPALIKPETTEADTEDSADATPAIALSVDEFAGSATDFDQIIEMYSRFKPQVVDGKPIGLGPAVMPWDGEGVQFWPVPIPADLQDLYDNFVPGADADGSPIVLAPHGVQFWEDPIPAELQDMYDNFQPGEDADGAPIVLAPGGVQNWHDLYDGFTPGEDADGTPIVLAPLPDDFEDMPVVIDDGADFMPIVIVDPALPDDMEQMPIVITDPALPRQLVPQVLVPQELIDLYEKFVPHEGEDGVPIVIADGGDFVQPDGDCPVAPPEVVICFPGGPEVWFPQDGEGVQFWHDLAPPPSLEDGRVVACPINTEGMSAEDAAAAMQSYRELIHSFASDGVIL